MTIRIMEIDDLPEVMKIERETFSAEAWTEEGFFTFLIRKDTLFLVVEEKGELIGYGGLLMVLDEADIVNIAVKKSRRKEGIGTFLLRSLLLLAGEQGIKYVHLEVRESNSEARRLYKRMKFKEDGLRRDYYTEPVENAVLMTVVI
ncbi:MAG: ribosomal protein S18-alanine N-acetyltransferase [Blautia sp.]|nr:ribosomal protein S18-alanine N-acetyltransferase [Blautia sp.]